MAQFLGYFRRGNGTVPVREGFSPPAGVLGDRLLEFLRAYVVRRPPGGAVLIHGKWGSGKSTFIRLHAFKAIAGIDAGSGKLRPLYLSVSGLATSGDLDAALLRAVYPLMNSSAAGLSGIALKAALRSVKLELNDIAPKPDLNSALAVVCIDDLERFCGAPQVLIGFVQHLIEEARVPVLLIGDEEKLQANDTKLAAHEAKYKDIREKVVSYAFKFEPSIDSAFDGLVDAVEDERAQSALRGSRAKLLTAIRAARTSNLRSVRAVIDLCRPIAIELAAAGAGKEQTDAVLTMIAATTLAIRKDHSMRPALVEFIRDRAAWLDFVLLSKSIDEPIQDFLDDNAALSPGEWPILPSIADYIETGIFESKAIAKDIQALSADNSRSVLPRALRGDVRLLSQEDFESMCARYMKYLGSNKPLKLATLVNGAATFLLFSAARIIGQTAAEVVDLHVEAMDRHRQGGTLDLHGYDREALAGTIARIRMHGEKEGERLATCIDENYRLMRSRLDEDRRWRLLQRMAANFAEFIGEAMDESKGWRRRPLFLDLSKAEQTAALIRQLDSHQLVALSDFLRWRRTGRGSALAAAESETLSAIRNHLRGDASHATGTKRTIADYALERLVVEMGNDGNEARAAEAIGGAPQRQSRAGGPSRPA
ncbi:KAP family NTPase [Tahibacter caeni]|uniref:KAP family NTPase n=1 Tax=Tahibacter caeni TaxID=1453545 RepID=UPI0021483FBB|nr:KAP family NTPase [Tahibacter caeni]